MKIIDKDLVVRSAVFLASILASASKRIEDDVAKKATERHMFLQRNNQLPDSVKKLFGIEHEFPLRRSSADQNAQKLFSQVPRSLNPEVKPEAAVVRLNAVICLELMCLCNCA